MIYAQCLLTRGTTSTVAWIPRTLAKVGHLVRLREQDGWTVASVGAHAAEADVLARRDDYRYQRRASDV